MMKLHHKLSKKAQVMSLVIVLAVIAVMGIGAYLMSDGSGSEISGAAVVTCSSCATCDAAVNNPDEVRITSPISSAGGDCMTLASGNVIIDCLGNSITGPGGSDAAIDLNGYDNVEIKNCDISEFMYGVVFNDVSASLDINIHDNTFSSMSGSAVSAGVFIAGNAQRVNVSDNTFSDSPYGVSIGSTAGDESLIFKNDFEASLTSGAVFINNAASSNNRIYLNNILSPDTFLDSGTNTIFCGIVSDTQISNEFGNYYDDGLVPSTNGCSDDYLATLPSQYTGTLPLLCGATILADYTMTEDLKNQTPGVTEGWTCPGDGLNVGNNDVSITCNYNHIRGINGSSQYGIAAADYTGLTVNTCDISNFFRGINWRGAGATLDYNVIHDNVGWGILLFDDADDFLVSNNNIFNNLVGLRLFAADGGDVEYNRFFNNSEKELSIENSNLNNITKNSFENMNSGSGLDLFLDGSSSNNDVWLNHFYGEGVEDVASTNDFCLEGNDGNFYKTGLTPAVGDCGPIQLFLPTLEGEYYYNVSEVAFEWDAQSGFLPITYYVDLDENETGSWIDWLDTPGVPQSDQLSGIDAEDVYGESSFEFRITPFDTNYNGSINTTGVFYVSNDNDTDGYSVLFLKDAEDAWDCNDNQTDPMSTYTHQPKNRESYSTKDDLDLIVQAFCYDTIDNDCDTGIAATETGGLDWLDHGCGGGFSAYPFSSELWTNGSISDIQTSKINGSSPPRYYVLINDTYGKIEYNTETNLSGVDFGDIFTIDYNHIEGNPAASNGDRFDKSAKITFTNLNQYRKIPRILVDGVPCPPEVCSLSTPNPEDPSDALTPFTGTLSFTANHFSTFTTTNNSRLTTFTQAESEARAYSDTYPKDMETYHRLKFFANYTKFPSGNPINDETGGAPDYYNEGECSIVLTDPFGDMITRTDYVEFSDDFNRGDYSPWFVVDDSYVNITMDDVSPVEQYAINAQMIDAGCPTTNDSCYRFDTGAVLGNTSNRMFNITFRVRANESGHLLGLRIMEDGGDNQNFNGTMPLATEWQTKTIVHQFNDDAGATASIAGWLTNESGPYEVYFDDIIVQTNGTGVMEYDPFYGLYVYESSVNSFDYPSDYYRYNISCESNIYEPINSTDRFTIIEDVTEPNKPVLYPQILLYPSNLTSGNYTYVAGYFGESDIDYTISILHSFWTWDFEGTTHSSTIHSEYKGTDMVVNFASEQGYNVTFVAWTSEFERALHTFDYVEFNNHNRTYFNRYQIFRANRTGDDIRIEFYQDLEEDVPIGTGMRLYTAPHAPGYFIKEVTLFGGSNRIAAWGVDQAGNAGNATHDWIVAPYPETAPVAPEFWFVPEAIRSDEDLELIGFINETAVDSGLNLTFNFWQGEDVNYVWDNRFNSSTNIRDSTVTHDAAIGARTFRINTLDYDDIIASADSWETLWVDFSTHNRTYWIRYNVTGASKPFGEDPIVNISGTLDAPLTAGVSVAKFHTNKYLQGWFNTTISQTALFNRTNRFFAVGLRGYTEGYPSKEYNIYKDNVIPSINTSDTNQYYYTRTPTINFTIKDDFKVDIETVFVNISNGTWNETYVYGDMNCTDLWLNQSEYRCTFMLNQTENGTYNMSFEIYDVAGWYILSQITNFTIIRNFIDITSVFDQDDITNDIYLLFNWTATGGELDYYEFALGTASYPDPDFNNVKDWNNSRDVLASYDQRWINFTHDLNASDLNATELKMITGTVYYLTVRAKNKAGEYGEYASSDGILFIDQTPPMLIGTIADGSPWSNDDTSLEASWTFQDNESDIIEYMYAVGVAQYPESGWDSVVSPRVIGLPYVINDGLSLTENETYYYNVKARNGNVAMNYSGSWSGWSASPGVQIDTIAPSGGFIRWMNQSYATSGFVTVQYDVGDDLPGTSNNVKGMIQLGRGPLVMDVCPSISDFDWYNNSDVLPSGSSYRDVNVSTGYCYVFRLYAWYNATNGVIYHSDNETLRIVKADTTPPSDVAPVIDDGFYTNSRSSLHADWQDSTDAESGFDKYQWKIFMQPTALGAYCAVNTSSPVGTNCSFITGGNSTASELSINNLNLTHNHKYFFEVRAWNKANLNSTSRYSDGIIYIDNAPPDPITIFTINEDNESSSPYLTKVRDGVINITAYGDLDGYQDIDNCVLLSDDIDYSEDGAFSAVLANCTESRVWSNESDFTEYLTNSSLKMITKVFCQNTTGITPEQATFEWFVSCRDPYWNTQSYAQNTLAWFTVDWPEPPKINVSMGDMSLRLPVYGDDTIYCAANITDSDTDPIDQLNTSNITFRWFSEGALIATHYTTASDVDSNGVYEAVDSLSPAYTLRGAAITCNVSAADLSGNRSSNTSTIIVSNTEPYDLYIVSPEDETVNNNMSFAWIGPYDDVDDDFMTLEVWVDNETNFNQSNDPTLSFGPPVQMTVGGSPITSTQQNPDIFENLIVYEDNRAGAMNLDIYMYNTETDEEISVSTASGNQINPKVYNNYIAYEDSGKIQLYNIDTSVTQQVASGITAGTMDFFGDYIAYHDGSNVKFKNINNLTAELNTGAGSLAISTNVYGNNIVWTNSDGTIDVYDVVNGVVAGPATSGSNYTEMFGDRLVVVEDNGAIAVTHIVNASNLSQTIDDVICGDSSMHGGLMACVNTSGGILIADIMGASAQELSIGVSGSNPVIYDKIAVFESGTDLYYAKRIMTLPARWQVEEPYSASYVYDLDTTDSPDDTYVWKIRGCDNSFANNSCVWGKTVTDNAYALFTVDNTPPIISSISPADGSIVAGQFRIYAKIEDAIGDVTYANYTVRYANGTLRTAGDMGLAGSVWKSDTQLDFLDINLSDFTLEIHTKDFKDNWNSATVGFTINNATPWFLFGGRGGTEIIDSESVFDNSIDSDFVAFTVTTSTIKIIGPLPKTTQRFIQSKNNLSITNHNYSDTISTLTWPDGMYKAVFTATNLDGPNAKNMTFYVDHNKPKFYNATTVPGGNVYASQPVTLSINWTDATLVLGDVNITYNNSNRNGSYITEKFNSSSTSKIFTSKELDLSAFINRTFYWSSTARDGLGRTNTTNWRGVFVESDNPTVTGTISKVSTAEDSFKQFDAFDLSNYFDDPNLHGDYPELDNLTYSVSHNCSTNLTFAPNPTTGAIDNVTTKGNYTGHCNITATATDYYGKQNSTWFILDVTPVNDAPTIGTIAITNAPEDHPAGIYFNLSTLVYDIDGDAVTYPLPIFDSSVFNLSQGMFNLTTGVFNFTLVDDVYGLYNITFKVTDGEYTVQRNATVNISAVNDAPIEPIIYTPTINSDRSGIIDVTWTPLANLDVDNETLWFSLEYSEDGTSWNVINGSIFNTSSYSWDSSVISEAENVTLRLNVTDNQYTNTTEQGNFTVDNLPPQITVITPTRVAVGSQAYINITTQEEAICTFHVNTSTGTWSVAAAEGSSRTHTQTPPGISQNVTYNLTITCMDDASTTPNTNVTSQLFELRANPLEFVSITPSQRWVYVGQELNLTLSVASNDTLSTIAINITAPSGSEQEFTVLHFSPLIDEDHKESYLNGVETLIPSETGQYTVQIIDLDSPSAASIGPFAETNIFEVFNAINQTLNTK